MTSDEDFAWYSDLAKRPGWRDYVREQAKELAADHPVLYADLPARLFAAFPVLTQVTLERGRETRENTYLLERSRFGVVMMPARKRKGRA